MSTIDPTPVEPGTTIETERRGPNQAAIVAIVVAVIALIVAAAWWLNRDPEPSDPTVAQTTTATATTTTAVTSAPASTTTQTQSVTAEQTQTATTTQTVAAQPTQAPATQAPAPTQTTQAPATQPAAAAVNAADYASRAAVGAGWYFASPDGNWLCGIAESGMVGCQSLAVYPSMPECGTNPDHMAAMVSWQAGDAQAVASCTTEGLFVAANSESATSPENRTLPQGSSLQVNGVVCESLPGAINCYPEGTNGGFHITADQIRT